MRYLAVLVAVMSLLPSLADAQVRITGRWAMEPSSEQIGVLENAFPDTSGAGSDGTMAGFPGDGTEWVPGVLGRGLRFDGVEQHVSHEVTLNGAAGTVAHWLRPDSDTGLRVAVYSSDAPGIEAEYNGYGSVFEALEIHTGVFNGEYYAIYQDGVGAINAPGSGVRELKGGQVVAGEWAHVAVTWNVAGDFILYVNCEEVARVSMADAVFAGKTPTDRYIGRPSQLGVRHWAGAMDEVSIRSYDFSADEIRRGYCTPRIYETRVLTNLETTPDTRWGWQVAMDGDWMLISGNGDIAHFYQRDSDGDWQWRSSRDTGTFNFDIALEGDIAVIGETVYVFFEEHIQLSEPDWLGVALLEAEPATLERLRSVDVSGDRVVVGAYSDGPSDDAFYVFERNAGGPDAFGRVLRKVVSGETGFGAFVDVDGDLVAVGSSDRVFLFERNAGGAGAWGNVGVVDASVLFGSPQFLSGVALRGDTVVFGTLGGSRLFVFRHAPGDVTTWSLEQIIEPNDRQVWKLGTGIAFLDDDLLAAATSSVYSDQFPEAILAERVSVFARDADGTWHQQAELLPRTFDPFHEMPSTALGYGGGLTGDRDTVIAGAPTTGHTIYPTDSGPEADAGRVVEFRLRMFGDGFEGGNP